MVTSTQHAEASASSSTTKVEDVLNASQIPSIPEALQQVLTAVASPSITGPQLEKLVLRDPGICVRILKTVNSSFHGLPNRITSINQAIVLLGFSTIKGIAAGLVIIETFGKMSQVEKTYLASVWGHCLGASALLPMLIEKLPGSLSTKKEDLLMAAVMHDVGHLIMSRHFGSRYLELRTESNFPSPEEERAHFGVDHQALSAELLKRWKFQPAVVDLVSAHHRYDSPSLDLQCLIAADILVECALFTPDFWAANEDALPVELRGSLSRIGKTWTEVQSMSGKMNALLASASSSKELA